MTTPPPRTRAARAAAVGLAGLTGGCYGADPYCFSRSTWSQFGELWSAGQRTLEIPVDAAPWLLRPCDHPVPEDCALIVNGARVPVEFDEIGAAACDLDADELLPESTPHVIHTLRLPQPLPPGATATLDCGYYDNPYTPDYYALESYDYFSYSSGPDLPLTLHVRNGPNPAAPPAPLTHLDVHYTRVDPNDCDPASNYLALSLDFDAAFLRQGGYIEAAFPNGQVFAIHSPAWDGRIRLPGASGPVKLTPVAVDGQRGDPVEVDPDEISADAVYIPDSCAVDPDAGPASLLALTALLALRRRRRSP